jgi:protein-tyrosine kinase
MNRVTDALRRAAEQAPASDGATGGTVASQVAEDLVARLAREPFPIELTEHRRSRPVAPTAPVVSLPDPPERPKAEAGPLVPKPTLIDRIDERLRAKVVVGDRIVPSSREQYRRLAAALHHSQSAQGVKVVMIASAVSGEGKTLTASNLALTLSESYDRDVLVIDADLRRPFLHVVFGIDASPGLSDGLTARDGRKLRSSQVSPRLAVLPAGEPNADPMAGLTSDRMHRLVAEARDTFDWVIIDTPPVTVLTDANLLAGMVDGAVLVVKASSTPFALVNRAIDAVGRSRILGVVLNHATTATADSGYYNSYYGGAPSPAQK